MVNKVEGPRNPADLLTKYLKRWEIELRLELMGLRIEWSQDFGEEDGICLTKKSMLWDYLC